MMRRKYDSFQCDIFSKLISIKPIDDTEKYDIEDIIQWLSNTKIYCREQSDNEIKHIVVVLLVLHGDRILLGHHKKANGWLPFGGHLEPNESLNQCACREFREELFICVDECIYTPFFVSQVQTKNLKVNHTDVGFWYFLNADNFLIGNSFNNEFDYIRWFDIGFIPDTPLGKNLERAIKKIYS